MFNPSRYVPSWRNAGLAILFTSILAGCAVKRDAYNVPQIVLPHRYLKAESIIDADLPSGKPAATALPANAISESLGEWWLLLGSSELNALMDQVLANNPDLRVATLRMAQLQARMDVTRASGLPEINVPVEIRNEAPVTIGSVLPGERPQSQKTYQMSLRGDWRPDLWGEFAAQSDAAQMQLWRSTFQRDDVQRNVVANAISAYVEYLSLNDRLQVAKETDTAVSEMLSAVAHRLLAGDASEIEYQQQKAAVYQVRATIPVLQQQREVVFNRLALFAGVLPANMHLTEKGLDSINFPSVMPGIPSALLLRRPDVRAVEAQLLAADADIDTARARILPPLDLTAQIGYGSHQLSDLIQPQNLAWNFIANLSANLFDGGKRSREVDFSRAIHEEMLETYVRVIYESARDVDDSLSAVKMMALRLKLQRISTDAAKQAWTYSQEVYQAGGVDYLVVLDTERTYTRNLDDWIGARLLRYQGLTNLFKALGGGVDPGNILPGAGDRPLALKTPMDYGAIIKPEKMPDGTAVQHVDSMPIATDAMQTLFDVRPAGLAESLTLTLALSPPSALRLTDEGIDWDEKLWQEPGPHWLVELASVYEHNAVFAAWRDLKTRFSSQVKDRVLIPHRLGLVTLENQERASWYRVYIGQIDSNDAAQKLCTDFTLRQLRCRVMKVTIPERDNGPGREPVFIEVKPEVATPTTQKQSVQ